MRFMSQSRAFMPSISVKAKTTIISATLTAALAVSVSAREADPLYVMGTNNAYSAADMYQQLNDGEDNVLFSPYSISSAMGMIYAGAANNTADEIAKAFHYKLPSKDFNPVFGQLNTALIKKGNQKDDQLSIANALCITGTGPGDDYQDLIANHYDAEIFSGDLNAINSWVEKKTQGKIDKILKKLSPLSACVLLNAVYFKGDWESQFDPKRTYDQDFNLVSGEKVKVPTMHQKGSFRLFEGEQFKMLEMPYTSGLTMQIYLPNEVNGLSGIERDIKSSSFSDWMRQAHQAKSVSVSVSLPKFKFETEYDLIAPCKKLGMSDCFNDNADFTGMGYSVGQVYISQIKHKAVIEVNEEGAEAAAATAVELTEKSAVLPQAHEFTVDRPFLFTICDTSTNTALFVGRVNDPTAK